MLRQCDILLAAALVGSVVIGVPASAQESQPITQMTCDELLAFYDKLPFTDILPMRRAGRGRGRQPDLTSASPRPASTTPGGWR